MASLASAGNTLILGQLRDNSAAIPRYRLRRRNCYQDQANRQQSQPRIKSA